MYHQHIPINFTFKIERIVAKLNSFTKTEKILGNIRSKWELMATRSGHLPAQS